MDIDISKENIQPLRGGRNLAQLGTALQAQSDVDAQRQLQLQKEYSFCALFFINYLPAYLSQSCAVLLC